MILPPEVAARSWRWTAPEVARAVAAGILADPERYELIEGRLVAKMSKKGPHIIVLGRLAAAAWAAVGASAAVRTEAPVDLSEESQPEPDLCIAAGRDIDYRERHPRPEEIRLVVEVSSTTLSDDLGWKLALYARAGVPEYLVIDVAGRRALLHTDPREERYRSVREVDDVFGVPFIELLPPGGDAA
jgi:Uma2 family endonuclease